MHRIKFYIYRIDKENINKKLIAFFRKHKIKFCYLNFGKKTNEDNVKIIKYKSDNLKELFIRILNQKEELCFFLHNDFDSYKDIIYMINKSKWYFKKYPNAGILDFNLNLSKYYHFYDISFTNYNKFYGLNDIKCPDPRCFVFNKEILTDHINFYIEKTNFARGLEIFISFFCYLKGKMVCRDICRKIKFVNNLHLFKTLMEINEKNYNNKNIVNKFNIFMENISNIIYFNHESNNESFYSQGPKKLIKILKPILKMKKL